MRYQVDDYVATHSAPVWRDQADFVFAAYLGTKDDKTNEWERLWGKRTESHRFILCCIPFFVQDLALGDEVETDSDFVFQRIVNCAGQSTFRIWFGGQEIGARTKIEEELKAINLLMEWSSENLLALSARDRAQAQTVADYLQTRENQGLLTYETGSTS